MMTVVIKTTPGDLKRIKPALREGQMKIINMYGRNVTKPLFVNSFYTFFYKSGKNKFKKGITWQNMTKTTQGKLLVPTWATSMDTNISAQPLVRKLSNKPGLRSWVNNNWGLIQINRNKFFWKATKAPRRATRLFKSRVIYEKRNVSKMKGYLVIQPRPWINHAFRKIDESLNKQNKDIEEMVIEMAFKKAGFRRN